MSKDEKYLLGGKIWYQFMYLRMNVMKTIKMVADELNVTKQTIVNNAKNLNISFKKKMELIILMIMIV